MNDVFRVRLVFEFSEDVLSTNISSSVTGGPVQFILSHDWRQYVSGSSHEHIRVGWPADPSSTVVPELAAELISPSLQITFIVNFELDFFFHTGRDSIKRSRV